ncbi:PPPDE putative peptidase domain-containing protein [Lipomyces orientalis]|uniref:PPPDE putative peptidase domain-containing protein n=1 Tax=Lipomyces orientalis TaxID=1233043 RepID=A0ACC3TT03_9ASCO
MSVSRFQEPTSRNTADMGPASAAATAQQSRPFVSSVSSSTSVFNSQLPSSSATFSASTSYTAPSSSATSYASSLTTSLLPSPPMTSSADGLKRKYSRPASLRSFSSTTQVTTVVTANGSAVSSPSTSQFPASTGSSSGPMPIPTTRRSQHNNTFNYRATNSTMPVITFPSAWSLSLSRNSDAHGMVESGRGYDGDRRLRVIINVYDLLQDSKFAPLMWTLGIGVYHSAVEIDGREYAYGGHEEHGISGIYYSKPKTPLPGGIVCKTSILHGYTSYSLAEVHAIISDLSSEYMGTSYNLLYKNCNHFTNSLLLRLTDRSAPAWLNRATFIGSALPCIIPQTYITPPECDVPVRSPSASTTSSSNRNEKSYDEMSSAPMAVQKPSLLNWSRYKSSSSQSSSLSLPSSPAKKIPGVAKSQKSSERSRHDKDTFESEPFLISTRYIEDEAVASDSGSDSDSDSDDGEGADSMAVDEKAIQSRMVKGSYGNAANSTRSSRAFYEKASIRTYSALDHSPQ